MKILCCCYGGNCRSVALARILKGYHGQRDVIAMGLGHTSDATKKVLFDWSEVVVVVGEQELLKLLPPDRLRHAIWINVGQDRWYNPFHPELETLIVPVVNKWLETGRITSEYYGEERKEN